MRNEWARSAVADGPQPCRLADDGVDDRHDEQHREDPEGHPPPEARRHRAASGTGTRGPSSWATGVVVTLTRGRRCDS